MSDVNTETGGQKPEPPAFDFAVWGASSSVNSEKALLAAEKKLIAVRRDALKASAPVPPGSPVAGLALSGGGIRSATFSLGILRELAEQKLLHRFDYLSTVSGGSYIGSYYCGLFAHRKGEDAVASAASFPDPFEAKGQSYGHASIEWLRQSGRYLAPTGAGDYLYAIAMLVRNWLGVHFVIGTVVLLLAMIAAIVRAASDVLCATFPILPPAPQFAMLGFDLAVDAPLLLLLPVPGVVLLALGWAYWLTQRDLKRSKPMKGVPVAATVAVAIVAAIVCGWALYTRGEGEPVTMPTLVALGIAVAGGGALVFLVFAMLATGEQAGAEEIWDARRVLLTRWLLYPARVTVVIAVVGLADALGFWVFRLSYSPNPLAALAATPLVAAVVVPIGRALLPRLLGATSGGPAKGVVEMLRPIALKAALAVVALVLVVAVWLFWSLLAYRLTWPVVPPASSPVATSAQRITLDASPQKYHVEYLRERKAAPESGEVPWHWGAKQFSLSGEDLTGGAGAAEVSDPQHLGGFIRYALLVLAVLVFLGACIGVTPAFLNLSSLATFYAGRLKRAYLGAGNRRRLPVPEPDPVPEAEQVPESKPGKVDKDRRPVDIQDDGDDILLSNYFHCSSAETAPESVGQPIHLLNVTLNETSSAGSNVVQRDRHGRNMALTPTGLYYSGADARDVKRIDWFEDDIEQLPLSAWVGISGAAFSTGLGAQTNLPMALVAGLTNVRLGYWWRSDSKSWGRLTQRYLLKEVIGSFPGPDELRWYLSDGGHFENTGAYELVRRKVPFIVVSDNGADAHYEYEDVANLVRKARIDFGTEIEFLDSDGLDDLLDPKSTLRESFGTLEQIAGKAPVAPGAVAAVARLTYSATERGTLVLIKPRLTGNGPEDLMRYKTVNPDFPQQTTLDQFFDEAQWESYYVLGRRIARAVFAASSTGWSPRDMAPFA